MVRRNAAFVFIIAFVAGPLTGRTKNGDEYLTEGAKAEQKRDYATALQLYDYAVEEDSRDLGYLAADQRVRRLASQELLNHGRALAQAQKLTEARAEFQAALRVDPHAETVQEELRKVARQIQSLPAPVVLDPANDVIYDLEIRPGTPRVMYENIAKQAGIKVQFDAAVIDSPVAEHSNVHFGSMSGVGLEDALNHVAKLSYTSWKALNRDTIFVKRGSQPEETAITPPHTPSPAISELAPEDGLRAASQAGKLADVVRLVLTGTDVNARDSHGMTALLLAATGNDPEIVRFLLVHGAAVDAVLPIAISRGHEQIVEVLLAAHADPNAPDATGTTPLQHALAGGKEEIVRSLLAHGADARQIDHSNNRGLLHQLCAQASTRFGSAQFIPLLIEFGADPAQRDQFGETPLDLALANKNESAVAALLKLSGAGAEKAMEDATLRGYTETARMLLENGLAPNQLTTRGSTYLGDAALKGQTAMVGLLLQHGANLALRDRFGGTPLHDAALGGSPAVINFLLDHGAEIDARNTDGRATPLMLAASMGSKETVQALLHRGANTHLLDSSGRTALDRARENANPEIVSLLLHDM